MSEIYKIRSVYVNGEGSLAPLLIDVELKSSNSNSIYILNNYIELLNSNIVLFRGLSVYSETTQFKFVSEKYTISYDNPKLNFYTLPEPSYGGIFECLTQNIQMHVTSEMYPQTDTAFGVSLTDAKPNNINNMLPLNMINIDDNGVNLVLYNVIYKLKADRNPNCDTCQQGLKSFKQGVLALSGQVYKNALASMQSTGNIVDDLDVAKTEDVHHAISLLLSNAIASGKIENFIIENQY